MFYILLHSARFFNVEYNQFDNYVMNNESSRYSKDYFYLFEYMEHTCIDDWCMQLWDE